MKDIPNVEMVIPEVNINLKFVDGKESQNVQVYGITREAMEALDLIPDKGELFNNKDENVFIVGQDIKKRFRKASQENDMYGGYYGGYYEEEEKKDENVKDMFEANIRASYEMQYGNKNIELPDGVNMPRAIKVKVVGELKGDSYEKSGKVYAPLKYVEKLIEDQKKYEAQKAKEDYKKTKKKEYYQVKIKVNEVKNVDGVSEQIKAMGFQGWGMSEIIKETNKMTGMLQTFLGVIGGVSLFIAAIGITNTMIMAIYERKKEIGVMKVIGADIKDIKNMFLSEAGMIGLIGGGIGLALSYGGSYAINQFTKGGLMGGGGGPIAEDAMGVSYIPATLAIGAIIFSILIGVIAGYLPAVKAMKISVLQAIKDD